MVVKGVPGTLRRRREVRIVGEMVVLREPGRGDPGLDECERQRRAHGAPLHRLCGPAVALPSPYWESGAVGDGVVGPAPVGVEEVADSEDVDDAIGVFHDRADGIGDAVEESVSFRALRDQGVDGGAEGKRHGSGFHIL